MKEWKSYRITWYGAARWPNGWIVIGAVCTVLIALGFPAAAVVFCVNHFLSELSVLRPRYLNVGRWRVVVRPMAPSFPWVAAVRNADTQKVVGIQLIYGQTTVAVYAFSRKDWADHKAQGGRG
ncbi:hypothetical protein [Streptomyces subrutilus]|uniref:Uncharacterized protein n=1 Tax=Streptomyces subrutilus TaxID=36818 RepID=A0A1E5NXR6_9ACTN|nr:hypothetical protein [Streptomyces subrutilus]OEJ21058.1 hypothetical protein BGK67_34765 [Streptomyces subrutilus]